jgi:hypothetical protein
VAGVIEKVSLGSWQVTHFRPFVPISRKNGLVEVLVGPPEFIVANAPSGSPNTWNFGMTKPKESLKAIPAARLRV